MRRTLGCLLIAVLLSPASLFAGIDKQAAMYLGGTVKEIPEQTEGRLDFAQNDRMIFRWKDRSWELPYKQIKSLEYGQKQGMRVGVAIAVSVLALFSRKRRHFLTLGFEDAQGVKHAALIEIGKAKVKASLAILEARTGLKVEYESSEARKHVHG